MPPVNLFMIYLYPVTLIYSCVWKSISTSSALSTQGWWLINFALGTAGTVFLVDKDTVAFNVMEVIKTLLKSSVI